MACFVEDQRRIAETMSRLEMGMSRPTPETQPGTPAPIRPQRATLSGQHRSTPEDLPTEHHGPRSERTCTMRNTVHGQPLRTPQRP